MNSPSKKPVRTPRKTKASGPTASSIGGGLISTDSISCYAQARMTDYSEEVNLSRSVPDLIDGLKPVQRRILWAAYMQGGRGFKKTARLVGDVIGIYHPHGDLSVAGAIETMVQHPTPALLGSGNWGGLLDKAAAMRYTNCKLSGYGDTFFQAEYICPEVTSLVPNYDGEDLEPVSLPALLPNILLNGGEGIGVGVTTNIPTFSPESVITVLQRILAGEQLEPKDFARTLRYESRWGGKLNSTKDNKLAYLKLFTSASASVQFIADLVVKREEKAIEIDDWPPGLNPVSFVAKVKAIAGVDQVFNHEGDTGFRIEMKRDYNYTQFDQLVEKVKKLAMSRRSFKINVTYRKASLEDGKTIFNTRFLSVSIPKLIMLWLRERLLLEKRSLENRLAKQAVAIAHSELLIYACSNLEVIFKALRTTDPKAVLCKALKLTPDQADIILELRVRQLSKLDKDTIEAKLKEQQAFLKTLQNWYKKPKAKVSDDLSLCLQAIEKDRKFEGVKEEELVVA